MLEWHDYLVAGVTALVDAPQDAAVCHLVDAVIADHHHIVDVKRRLMPMGKDPLYGYVFCLFSHQLSAKHCVP